MLKVPCLSLNKRKIRKWIRNTELNYELLLGVPVLIIIAISAIVAISTAIEMNLYNQYIYKCPNIRRIIIPQVSTEQVSFQTVQGNISAYNALPEQTDDTPCITADGTNICGTTEKIVANNCLPFNTIVEIDGIEYRVADRLNKRFDCSHYDLLFESYDEAIQFGRQTKQVIIKI